MEQKDSEDKSLTTITTVSSINLVSDIKVRCYDCKWAINNFRFCCSYDMDSHSEGSMQSPKFDTDGFEWSLDLFPENSINDKHLSVRLYSPCNGDLYSRLEKFYATMSIINNQKEEVCTQRKTFTEQQLKSNGAIFERIVDKSYLYDENNGLMENHQLTLLCKIFINENVFIVNFDDVKNTMNERRLNELDDFEKLLEDRKFSDVRIVVGDKTFHAHKAVLSVRSSVFAAMFNHGMKEQKESRIDITDFDAEVIEQLLFFIYSGTVDLDQIERLASKLFAVADKYEIEGLKIICEQALIVNLKIDNIAEILQLVDKHGSETLCEAAFKFLRKNRFRLTFDTNSDEDLAGDLEAVFSSLSPGFLAKVIRSLLEEL